MKMKNFTMTKNADGKLYRDYKVWFSFVRTKNEIPNIYRDHLLINSIMSFLTHHYYSSLYNFQWPGKHDIYHAKNLILSILLSAHSLTYSLTITMLLNEIHEFHHFM